MTLHALTHEYPTLEADENEGGVSYDVDSMRLVYRGLMRVVRSRKRMRLLRRRGVPMMHLGVGDGVRVDLTQMDERGLKARGPWAWFEVESAYALRYAMQLVKRRTRALQDPDFTDIPAHVQDALQAYGCGINPTDEVDIECDE